MDYTPIFESIRKVRTGQASTDDIIEALEAAYRTGLAGAQEAIDAERERSAAQLLALENKLRLFQSPRYYVTLSMRGVTYYLKRNDCGVSWHTVREAGELFDLTSASDVAAPWRAILEPAR